VIRRRIVPDRRSRSCTLELPRQERQLLETLPLELSRALRELDQDGPPPEMLRRLFPRAYVRDDPAQMAYAASTHDELTSARLEALDTVVRTARARALTEEQMHQWMRAITDLRLVLGTVLDVTDTGEYGDLGVATSSEQSSEVAIYEYLSLLLSELIDVMEQWLPEPLPGADDAVPDDPWGEPLGGLRWDGTEMPDWPPRPEW
jgi:hypothetical protein